MSALQQLIHSVEPLHANTGGVVDDTSLKVRLERLNHASDCALDNLKHFYNGGSILKRYLDGVLQIEVLIRINGTHSTDYVTG